MGVSPSGAGTGSIPIPSEMLQLRPLRFEADHICRQAAKVDHDHRRQHRKDRDRALLVPPESVRAQTMAAKLYRFRFSLHHPQSIDLIHCRFGGGFPVISPKSGENAAITGRVYEVFCNLRDKA